MIQFSNALHLRFLYSLLVVLLFSVSVKSATTTTSPVDRRMAARVFSNAGKKPGLEIWRVENFSPVPVKSSDFGKFYEGDSYVVLKTKEANKKLSWDLHFWLGSKTSQDESGAAAILAVELDDALGGAPVQHREVQDHESQLFLSHFPSGVRYLPGGVSSGFKHVTTNDPGNIKRLYQVKGKRNIRIRQIEPSVSAMNKGDSFILDTGSIIYVYYGTNSKRTERLKAVSAANQIRDQDHAGRSRVVVLDESASQDEIQQFFTALGSGSPSAIPDESRGGDDEQFERDIDAQVTLYKVSDASGSLKIEKVGQKPLRQSSLNTNDCFVLDTVTAGLYSWIGRRATKSEKEEAMKKAQEFLRSKNYPQWTQITRVVEGGEPSTFKQFFSDWRESGDRAGLGRVRRALTVQQIAESMPELNYDPDALTNDVLRQFGKNAGSACTFLPDCGDGDVEVYRVENFELVPIDESQHGMFFGGDSYVVRYTYDGNKQIIYYWLGKDSTQDERTAAAIHTVRLDNEAGRAAVQIRVTQGNEPRHFNRIFKGKMILFSGGRASGFRNIKDYDTYDVDGTRLFRIRGTISEDVRAEQLPEVASSLDTDDTFLLETPNGNFLWFGQGTSELERSMAQSLLLLLNLDTPPVSIEEGEEPDTFWEALGGKGDYNRESESVPILKSRLFHIYLSENGHLKTEEIFDFKKQDLSGDDVFLLDSGDEVYVWLGGDSDIEEIKQGLKLAQDYASDEQGGRTGATIITVRENDEPKSFTTLFDDWNDSNDV